MSEPSTIQDQAELEKLPLPTIQQSVKSILRAIEPLLTKEAFANAQQRLESLESNELIQILQKHLEDYNNSHDCYLDLFSNVRDHNAINIYSEYRGQTLPKNPYFILENDPNNWSLLPPKQSERAAILTFSSLKFISTIKLGVLTVDMTPKSSKPLSMKSINYLFGSTRVPSAHGNGINVRHYHESKHIAILCQGQFYYLEVLDDKNNIIINQSNLQKIFDSILIEATANDNDENLISICSVTTESINEWKVARDRLNSNDINEQNLKLIDSALMIINLDTNTFMNDVNSIQNICHGTSNIDEIAGVQNGSCNSRWYDKLQLIVSADSLAAIIWEPTSNDATIVLRYVSDIYTDSILRLARNIDTSGLFSLFTKVTVKDEYNFADVSEVNYSSSHFYKINWDFSDKKLLHSVHLAETRLGDLLCQFDSFSSYLNYGNKFFEKTGLNSDSLIQLSIQLTHYALYGTIVSSCESISTRRFKNARSELCFIQSQNLLKICQSFVSTIDGSIRWKLIKHGIEEINQIKNEARSGKGFEKYIKALKLCIFQKDYLNKIKSSDKIPDIPDLKTLDPLRIPSFLADTESSTFFKELFDPEILAINCGNPSLKCFGITPFKPNGFGIGYIIKDDYTTFTISSNFRQNSRFFETLKWTFQEINKLFLKFELKPLKAQNSSEYSTADMIRSVSMTLSESLNHNKDLSEDELHDNYDDTDHILGGYGYFDVGELEFRSHSTSRQISRAQSKVNLLSIKE